MYEKFEKLCKERGVTPYRVSQETGISRPTLTNWKNGKFNLKLENLQKIADYFDVPVEYFIMNDEQKEYVDAILKADQEMKKEKFYADPAAAEMMQKLFESPGRRALFKAVENMDEESVRKYAEFIERITNDNNKGN